MQPGQRVSLKGDPGRVGRGEGPPEPSGTPGPPRRDLDSDQSPPSRKPGLRILILRLSCLLHLGLASAVGGRLFRLHGLLPLMAWIIRHVPALPLEEQARRGKDFLDQSLAEDASFDRFITELLDHFKGVVTPLTAVLVDWQALHLLIRVMSETLTMRGKGVPERYC